MDVTPNIQFPINFLSLSRYRNFTYKQFARQYAYYPTKGQLDLFNNWTNECFHSFISPVLTGTRRVKKKKKKKKKRILTRSTIIR